MDFAIQELGNPVLAALENLAVRMLNPFPMHTIRERTLRSRAVLRSTSLAGTFGGVVLIPPIHHWKRPYCNAEQTWDTKTPRATARS